jgi:polysaccharide pyruvyl transferase WcaK-like protein
VIRRARSTARAAVDLVGAVASARRQDASPLLIAPAAMGSLGDELLVRGALALLPADVRVAAWSARDQWPATADAAATKALRARQHLAGPWTRFVSSSWSSAVFIGADVLDGTYNLKNLAALDLLDAVAARGRPAAVVGFSFSTRPLAEMVERIRGSHPGVRFVARGEASAARFRAATGRPCAVAPDLSWAHLALVGLPSRAPDRSPVRIGVNLGAQVVARYGGDAVLDVFESVARRLLDEGCEVVALPHDFRGASSDLALLDELARRVEVHPAVSRRPDAEVWHEAGRCRAVLSCRMHLSIAALAHGVPVVAMGYQDKFEDVARSPDLRDRIAVVDSAGLRAGAVLDAVHRAMALPPVDASSLTTSRRDRRAALEHVFAEVLGPGSGPA